jgi:tRNA nucleotidyltransferase (CCA-adding enzyme)
MAKTRNERTKRSISTFFTKLRGTKIFLRGKDLITTGYKPGSLFKEIFNSILEAKLEGDVSTKEDEIEFVNKRFGSLLNNQSLL